MRFTACLAAIAIAGLAACDSPPAQNSPPQENLVNATRTDQAFPSGATGNDIITGGDVTAEGVGNSDASANTIGGGQNGSEQTNGQ